MADSVRMIDLAAQERGLENFRRIDPEQRVLSERLAADAAALKVENAKKDVSETERAAGARIRPRTRDGEGQGDDSDGRSPPEEQRAEAVPEQDEGHVLDVTV